MERLSLLTESFVQMEAWISIPRYGKDLRHLMELRFCMRKGVARREKLLYGSPRRYP